MADLVQPEASSSTPTHHYASAPSAPEYESPSAYLNDPYAQVDPNTPHAYDPLMPATASGLPPPPMDDVYTYNYSGFHPDGVHSTLLAPVTEQSTPPGAAQLEEDSTPVIPTDQAQIHPSNLPRPPNYMINPTGTIRPASQGRPSLMSPFKADPQAQVDVNVYPLPIEHQQYMNDAAYYNAQNQYAMQQISPMDQMAYAQGRPAMMTMQAPMAYMPIEGVYPGQQGYPMPSYSRDGSPTSVTSGVALSRNGSLSSAVRAKVKLTYNDKREIVNLHRRDSSLRQEDIAKLYGVDRSTISKIILSAHRWTQPQEPQLPVIPKPPKAIGGRFPAVEAKLDEWMDMQIAAGHDVRDSVAREQAKIYAREIGFPTDRFKASAKWLDKFKERRRAAGKAVMTSPIQGEYGFYPLPAGHFTDVPIMEGSVMLSRSQSTATMSSSDSSSQEPFQPTPQYLPAGNAHVRMASTRSESDLLNTDTTPNSRSRSQSSPQVFIDTAMQSPSSGKAPKQRPTPVMLQRQNSYHGSSPSPRRPTGLVRTNSTQGTARRHHRPLSLAASAFGFTNMTNNGTQSPLQSPATTASSSSHSRQRSDSSLAPCTNGFSSMTISPNISEFGDTALLPMPMTVPPLTPITPAQQAAAGVFPNTDYGDFQPGPPPPHHILHQQPQYAATMPNKHYTQSYYAPVPAYPVGDFGQAYMIPTNGVPQWQ